MRIILIFTILATVSLTGCRPKEHVQPEPHWFKHYTHYHEKDYVHFVQDQIGSESDSTLKAALTREGSS